MLIDQGPEKINCLQHTRFEVFDLNSNQYLVVSILLVSNCDIGNNFYSSLYFQQHKVD